MTTRIEATGTFIDILARGCATYISSLGSKRASETNVYRRKQMYEPLPEHWRTLRVACRGGEALAALDDPNSAEHLTVSISRVLVELGDTTRKMNLLVDHLRDATLNFCSAPEPTGGELERMVGLGRLAHTFFDTCSKAALEASSGQTAPRAEHIALIFTSLTSSRHLASAKSRRAWRFHLLTMEDQLRLAEGAAGSQGSIGKNLLAELQRLHALIGDLPAVSPMSDMNLPAML